MKVRKYFLIWIIQFKLTSVLCIKTLARSSNLNYSQTFFHYKRSLYSESYKNNIHEFLHRQTFSLSLFFETRIILKKLLFTHEIGIDRSLHGKHFGMRDYWKNQASRIENLVREKYREQSGDTMDSKFSRIYINKNHSKKIIIHSRDWNWSFVAGKTFWHERLLEESSTKDRTRGV